ncbi:MAG TPA: DUF480 domain-containing protein [Gemmataceae bacterium]|jgi:hypothetical protein|nr:DUF480 domain-containing protein [Gemmataceae bacterium]
MDAPVPSIVPPANDWPALSLHGRRILGVLIEKAKTTPDAYPMSMNGLITGANQKSNRDPILQMNDEQVEETLEDLQKILYVIRITGGSRVERWRHNLYEAWRVEKVELAILGELLLRGPQTEGELRGRASRMEPIADLETLRNLLGPLRDRKLIVYLTPEDRRGTVLTHGFHGKEELAHLKAKIGSSFAAEAESPSPRAAVASPPSAPAISHRHDDRLDQALAEIADLKTAMAELRTTVAALEAKLKAIADGLGM